MKLAEINSDLGNRVTITHKSAKLYDDGDHWQDGEGFLPFAFMDAVQRAESKERIKKAFVSENVIGKVITNEQNGLLAREPDYSAVPDDDKSEALKKIQATLEAALVKCLNGKEYLKLFREAFRLAATQSRAIVRAYVPPGYLDQNQNIKKQPTLLDAMNILQFEVLSADKAGIFKDAEFRKPYGVFISEKDGVKNTEITWTDENKLTRLRVVKTTTGKLDAELTLPTLANYIPKDTEKVADAQPLDLGGTILLFEIERTPLIDESIISNQKSVNQFKTMKARTCYQNGHRDAFGLNAQEPEDDDGNPTPIELGGGQMNFLKGAPVYKKNASGEPELQGYATASLQLVDPVDPDTFTKGEDSETAAIYRQCNQEHLTISESATVAGVSKEESRVSFDKNLKGLKPIFGGLGRWYLTTTAYFGIANSSEISLADLKRFRFDFNCIEDAGAPSPEIIKSAQLDVKEGRLSSETYLSKYRGMEDADAETSRLSESESYKLALTKQRLEVAQMAKNLNLPAQFIVDLMNVDEEQKEAVLAALKAEPEEVEPKGLPVGV